MNMVFTDYTLDDLYFKGFTCLPYQFTNSKGNITN